MIKLLNSLYNVIFRCSLFMAVLAIFCKITKILSMDSYIFSSNGTTIITAVVFIILSLITAGQLHRLLARLQEEYLE